MTHLPNSSMSTELQDDESHALWDADPMDYLLTDEIDPVDRLLADYVLADLEEMPASQAELAALQAACQDHEEIAELCDEYELLLEQTAVELALAVSDFAGTTHPLRAKRRERLNEHLHLLLACLEMDDDELRVAVAVERRQQSFSMPGA